MSKISVCLLGGDNPWENSDIPAGVRVLHLFQLTGVSFPAPEITILQKQPEDGEIEVLEKAVLPYTLFVTEQAIPNRGTEYMDFFLQKCGRILKQEDRKSFLRKNARYFFSEAFGIHLDLKNLAIGRDFTGKVVWNGNISVELEGDFGKQLQQVVYYRGFVDLLAGCEYELFMENEAEGDVSLMLETAQFTEKSGDTPVNKAVFTAEQLRRPVHITGKSNARLFLSLRAQGNGRLRIKGIHFRRSRGTFGYFLPGGERYVTSKQEELYCYFCRGKRKAPFVVFFSDFHEKEGFDGVHLFRRLGVPFLLLTDTRAGRTGGYLGTHEYEELVRSVIREKAELLSVPEGEMIFSGISMGAMGAAYYAGYFSPGYLLLGKPLAGIGTIAKNGKHVRPGIFPEALDLMLYRKQVLREPDEESADRHFWERTEEADFSDTSVGICYMSDDDFDPEVYRKMTALESMTRKGFYRKEILGRHNDAGKELAGWMTDRFEMIIKDNFSQEEDVHP